MLGETTRRLLAVSDIRSKHYATLQSLEWRRQAPLWTRQPMKRFHGWMGHMLGRDSAWIYYVDSIHGRRHVVKTRLDYGVIAMEPQPVRGAEWCKQVGLGDVPSAWLIYCTC